MNKRFVGRKAIPGLLAVVLTGALGVAASAASAADDMVLIPAGKFIYGKAPTMFRKGTQQEIDLPAFLIDQYEVTNEQYVKIKADHKFEPGQEKLPAVWVSQMDADAYCEAVGKRLPTEQEWEKAARGTDGRLYPWGEDFDPKNAVTSESAEGEAAPVGSCEGGKSPYGVMDMAGNVWEWTSTRIEGNERYFVLRGGSYFEDSRYSTTTSTLSSIPGDSKQYIGFRCVKNP